MVDFIFVVDDPEDWHAQNMERNGGHYSAVRWLGPRAVAAAADCVGAGVWFNTLVPLGGRLVKYGVVGRHAFLEDVTAWRHLYVPGRLHKPVLPLTALRDGGSGSSRSGGSSGSGESQQDAARLSTARQQSADDRAQLAAALDANLLSALRVALLLSPPAAAFRDVIRRVAGLSYHGDVRMGLAEDSRKVERIVKGSWPGFCDLYLPLLRDGRLWGGGGGGFAGGELLVAIDGDGGSSSSSSSRSTVSISSITNPFHYDAAAHLTVHQASSQEARMALIADLPAALLLRIANRTGVKSPWAAAAAFQAPAAPGMASPPPWPRSELAEAAAGWRRDVAWAAVRSGRHEKLLHSGLASIIRSSSARQAAVGVLSAGLVKSARYVGAKLSKAWRR
jgi:hypothetical protein